MNTIKRLTVLMAILILMAILSSCEKQSAHDQEEIRLIVESLIVKGKYTEAAKKTEEFEKYESAFPYKEKLVLPGQLGPKA